MSCFRISGRKDQSNLDPEKTSLVNLELNAQIQPAVAANSEKATPSSYVVTTPNAKQGRGSAFKQVVAALVAQLGTINTGMVFGFSAIAIPQMRSADSFIEVNDTVESWIASINAIGTPIGCFLSGYLSDLLGRKMTLIITQIPTLLGWVLITFATNIDMIYAGRFFVGLGSGMVGAPARVYAAEVTQPHLRGMLVAIASVGVSTGVLVEYIIGGFLHWQICAAISSVVPLTSLILIFLFPETPSYLMSRQKPEQARRALGRLRGKSCNLEREMDVLINFSKQNKVQHLSGPSEILRAILQPKVIKPFIVLALYFLIYQWSGTNAITFYAVEIFQASGAKMDKNYLTMILGAVRLVSTVAACILCRRCGRRPLTFVSSIGCALSMLGLGIYKFATMAEAAEAAKVAKAAGTTDVILNSAHSWIPVFCIFSYTIFCTLGFLVIPWVMIGEVYPVQVRGIVGGLTTMSAHIFVFTVVKSFPFLRVALTEPGIYLMFGMIPLLGTVYLYIFLPETKGRSLQEIEDYYSGRTKTLGPAPRSVAPSAPQVLEPQKGQLLP
ncbi:facilitated trehalose transporter Tret1-2 homolog isoform X1 [Neodiprion fabricii]|uniref:facilitated trehalose transporter Tret1-2 homolog isoform X1 n=1 Tax=Neodiprion fabricii TaxID=2872261 RepID=UPI001ED8E5F7|nr:facilitated trehalose transporter Tret1-2 homolog isoform X1 [Neodiprion fabricii]